MRVYQVQGYPRNYYFVKYSDWSTMTQWLSQNGIRYLHESSGMHGIGFSIRSDPTWFLLRWV